MNERITIRVTAEMKAALERFHQDQVEPVRSRQDAFCYIIEDWLVGHDYLQPQPSVQEGRGQARGRTCDPLLCIVGSDGSHPI